MAQTGGKSEMMKSSPNNIKILPNHFQGDVQNIEVERIFCHFFSFSDANQHDEDKIVVRTVHNLQTFQHSFSHLLTPLCDHQLRKLMYKVEGTCKQVKPALNLITFPNLFFVSLCQEKPAFQPGFLNHSTVNDINIGDTTMYRLISDFKH